MPRTSIATALLFLAERQQAHQAEQDTSRIDDKIRLAIAAQRQG